MFYTINYDINGYPSCLTRNSDKASIPFDERNSDFIAFLEWNAQQVEPLDWKTPKEMPASISPSLSVDKRLDKLSDLLVIKGIFTQEDLDKVNSYDLVP